MTFYAIISIFLYERAAVMILEMQLNDLVYLFRGAITTSIGVIVWRCVLSHHEGIDATAPRTGGKQILHQRPVRWFDAAVSTIVPTTLVVVLAVAEPVCKIVVTRLHAIQIAEWWKPFLVWHAV